MLDFLLNTVQNIPGSTAFLAVIGILLLCGIGLPIPEEIPLFIAGYLVYDESISLGGACFYTTAAILVGDSVLFWVGYRYGNQVFQNKFVEKIITPQTFKKVNNYFHKFGNRVIFIVRFVAGLRAPVYLMAGVLKMPYRRFILLDGVAAILSAPLIVWVTYHFCSYFGGETSEALKVVRKTERGLLIVAVLVVLIVSLVVIRYQRRKKSATLPS